MNALAYQARLYLRYGTPFEDLALCEVFNLYRAWKRGHTPDGRPGVGALPPNLFLGFGVLEDAERCVEMELEALKLQTLAKIMGAR